MVWRGRRAGCAVLAGMGLAMQGGCAVQRVAAPAPPPAVPAASSTVLWSEPFETLDAARWREISMHGHTAYQAVTLEGRRCLQARSRVSASVLVTKVRFDLHEYPWLSWQWRVDQPVEGEALDRKEGSDAAARIYVYFDTPGPPWQKRNLDYVWSAVLPVGTFLTSRYASQSKILVVENGSDSPGRWRTAERNVLEDYRLVFKAEPPAVVALGVMSDTDNTRGAALAYFDDLQVSRVSGASMSSASKSASGSTDAREGAPFNAR